MTIVDCPFEPCNARVELIVEQATPDDDESTVNRIPTHQTEGTEWFGPCPASLMTYPLTSRMIGPLHEQEHVHRLMREARDAQPQPASEPAPPHSRAPRPAAEPYWFRSHTGENPRGEAAVPPPTPMEQVRVPLGILPGARPTEGESMASVGDSRAAIDQANNLIDEARKAAKTAADKFLEASAIVHHIQGTTTDTLGAAELAVALESCNLAITQGTLAIEKNTTYGSTL